MDKLFDICSCTCPQVTCGEAACKEENCHGIHIKHIFGFGRQCSARVDEKELPFLMDQRGKREMFIGGIHLKDTEILQQDSERAQVRQVQLREAQGREAKERERVATQKKQQAEANRAFFSETTEELPGKRKTKKTDCDYNPEPVVKVKQRKNHSLTHTCNAADRIDIGNRSASHLCNNYAKDMGWLTSENRLTHTLDRSKVGKQRRREREKIKAKEEKEISSRPAMVFDCDGTNPNIGRFQGCLLYLEKLLGHAVHCEVCLLYAWQ